MRFGLLSGLRYKETSAGFCIVSAVTALTSHSQELEAESYQHSTDKKRKQI